MCMYKFEDLRTLAAGSPPPIELTIRARVAVNEE